MPLDSKQPMSTTLLTTRGLPSRSTPTGHSISAPASTVGEASIGRKPFRTLMSPPIISSPAGRIESVAQFTKRA